MELLAWYSELFEEELKFYQLYRNFENRMLTSQKSL